MGIGGSGQGVRDSSSSAQLQQGGHWERCCRRCERLASEQRRAKKEGEVLVRSRSCQMPVGVNAGWYSVVVA